MPATNGKHITQIHPKLNCGNAQWLSPVQQGKELSQLSVGLLLGPEGNGGRRVSLSLFW